MILKKTMQMPKFTPKPPKQKPPPPKPKPVKQKEDSPIKGRIT